MDPFHERLARVALDAAGPFGFVLAGGYAVQVHGFLDRLSSDVDLFAEARAEFEFTQAVDVVIAAYLREGLKVDAELRRASVARLNVRSATDSAKVELGLDWREKEPIQLEVGPVLHVDDAVANKVCALFGRAEVRDYIDVDAILASGRYTEHELLGLAADHDPGFSQSLFAEALTAIDRLPDSLFQPYGLSPEDTSALRERMRSWARRISAFE
ncbi:MAG: nucleotidyl transferase AbiEii/AbiGii toxin family protein [Streptosporangiaceae bacterium]